MPWRSPSRLRSEPGAAARQAPFAGGRLLTVMMLRGYYRPSRDIGAEKFAQSEWRVTHPGPVGCPSSDSDKSSA